MGEPSVQTHPTLAPFSRRYQVKLVGEGALVGVAAGLVVSLYRMALGGAEESMRRTTQLLSQNGAAVVIWLLVVLVLARVVYLIMKYVPDVKGSGIPLTEAEVAGIADACWWKILPAKFVSGVLVTLAGLSLGREGPSVQLGGSAAKAVSRGLKRPRGEERLLITCGAAAGISAAFHAPLAGVLFAVEEIHREFSAPLVIAVMTASAVADFVASNLLGIAPVVSLGYMGELPHIDYIAVIVLGVLSGFLGAGYNKGLYFLKDVAKKLDSFGRGTRITIVFVLSAVLAFVAPQLLCGGDALIASLGESWTWSPTTLIALLLAKAAVTAMAYSSDAPGGTLMPLVAIGCTWGALFGLIVVRAWGMDTGYVTNFIALGMAGIFAASVRAPVTAVVLVFELTGSFDALLSLATVSVIAYVTANITRVVPFYENGLAPLMAEATHTEAETSTEKSYFDVVVGAGSQIEGQHVAEIPWPNGARIVYLERSGEKIIPTGDTVIMALDCITFIVDETESHDLEFMLRSFASPSFE